MHRLRHARIDQRFVLPIAFFVDATYAALGTATGANLDYWARLEILLGLQIFLVIAILNGGTPMTDTGRALRSQAVLAFVRGGGRERPLRIRFRRPHRQSAR